jgi:DNA-binding CsgD family transcriptional regulator
LDDAEGFAARGEDAARASGSVLQQARALKIRYGVAMLRGDLDVAAVHVGRLTTLQAYVTDPNERASDLVSALEVEVYAGRAARAAAFDDAIRRAGHGWLDMETYVTCRAVMDAWEGRLIEATDRLSAYNALLEAAKSSRFPLALASFFAAAAGATARAGELIASLPGYAPPENPFVRSHYEMASSFAAMTEAMLERPAAAARRLKPRAKTALGGLFLDAARAYVGSGDPRAYAAVMRRAGFDGIARAMEVAAAEAPHSSLSMTEREVLAYLANGLGAAQIADLTGRSIHTVRNQRRSIVEKLGAANTFEAVAIARRRGLL